MLAKIMFLKSQKRLKDVVRAEGEEVLHTKEEVERIRQEAQKTRNEGKE